MAAEQWFKCNVTFVKSLYLWFPSGGFVPSFRITVAVYIVLTDVGAVFGSLCGWINRCQNIKIHIWF